MSSRRIIAASRVIPWLAITFLVTGCKPPPAARTTHSATSDYVHRGASVIHQIAVICAKMGSPCSAANIQSVSITPCPSADQLKAFSKSVNTINTNTGSAVTDTVVCSADNPAYTVTVPPTGSFTIYQSNTNANGVSGCRYVIFLSNGYVEQPSDDCN